MVSWRSVSRCARATLALLVALFTPLAAHGAAVITVPAGGNLQAALDAAAPGDTIVLEPGATYIGNFLLPAHGGTAYVTLRTGGDLSRLPGPGVRMTPAYASALAKIQSPNGVPALATRAGAAYWRVMLLEFGPNKNGAGDVIALGSGTTAQSTLSVVPHHLVLDRVYVHGDPGFGQKRGIALNSAETTVINSHVSEVKSTTQDTQAIAGWNGPGPFRIENNYLEAAGYPVMFGGDSPKISELVPSNVTFRGNLVRRPVSWRAPIVATPTGLTTTAGTGGSLLAGTYAYRVVARRPVGTTTATSARSAEVQATAGAGGKVTIHWTAVAGATEYRVYGRTVGGQTMYWTTTTTSFTDSGAAGTAGTPPSTGTVWLVKNLFELKNARNVQIDYNTFENHWRQAQPGPAILFTPRNSNSACAWCVVENVTFEYNVVRNIGAGFHILGIDPNPTAPSQQANNIRIRHNEISGLDKDKWGGTGYFLLMVNTPRDIQVDHNTIISPSGSGIVMMDHEPIEDFVYTNNLARHNANGIIGSGYGPGNPAIAAYLPNAIIRRNVIAGGKASIYPADNYFPTVTEFESMFVDYAGGDYRLKPGGNWANAGTDGRDLGADYAMLLGQPDSDPTEPPRIVTATMPDTTEFEAYNTMLQAAGGTAPYRWSLVSGSLPSGLTLSTSGQISGATTTSGDYTFTVQVTDAKNATAVQALRIHVEDAIPPVQIVTTAVAGGIATLPYEATLEATGGLGSYTWSLAGGTLPTGVTLSSAGVLKGTPAAIGSYSFAVKAQDASAATRYSTRAFVLDVANAPNQGPSSSSNDVVLYAKDATVGGGWTVTADATAAGGARLQNPNAGAATAAVLASPTQYFEMTFNAEANVGYRLWMRGIATSNNWANDSVFVQFDQSVDAVGTAVYRIGTTSATTYTLEDCTGCGLSGWGWQDNGFGVGALGPVVYFENSGVQRIRVQVREDGLGIDQIVLSPETFLMVAPGPSKNDGTIVAVPTVTTQTDVVLHTKNATTRPGWTLTSDATAASGARLQNANAGAAKVSTPLAAPTQYFEMTFNAEAGVGYRLWMRGNATSNNWANDSVFVQFDRSVDQNSVPMYRIGTTSATTYTLEDCTGCGLSGWGWQDNGFGTGVLGPLVYFAQSGVQRIRVQVREDGLGIDQIVLSPSRYRTAPPGAAKDDATIVTAAAPATRKELVLYAKNAPVRNGWTVTADATAAGGARLQNANAGAAKVAALASPTQYFEMTFDADAGVGYRLWMRGTATSNNWANDSAYVQFDRSVDSAKVPVYRIGTTSATSYTLEDCTGCGLSGWGWQDNGFGTGVLGPLVYFAQSGTQRIRVQVREDGLGLDQIVLSAEKYLQVPPGAAKNDTKILPQ